MYNIFITGVALEKENNRMEAPSEYLYKIVNEIDYDEDKLKIYWGDDR